MNRIVIAICIVLLIVVITLLYKSIHTRGTHSQSSYTDSGSIVLQSMHRHLFLTERHSFNPVSPFVKHPSSPAGGYINRHSGRTNTFDIPLDVPLLLSPTTNQLRTDVSFKGNELNHTDFLFPEQVTGREQIMIIQQVLQEGDYVSGAELALLFRHDKALNKVFRNAFSHYLEKNIRYIEKSENTLIIHTIKEGGVYTSFTIPFLKECSVRIADKSIITIGDVFVSSEPLFLKSYLLPIKLEGIQFIQNGEVIPDSGYVSGNYYFIDYARSTLAYKIR